MDEEIEIIDLNEMRVLREFPLMYENDEEKLVPHLANVESCAVGVLKNLVVLTVRTKGNEERSFQIAFDRQNAETVAAKLKDVLKNSAETGVENEITERGADSLLIGIRSNFPHNLLAPYVRAFIKNLRAVAARGQNLDQRYWDLSLPPRAAQKLAEELENLIEEQKI
ncbi:MAG TPA: hypothetical protein VGB00_00520 [Pyrinomonadaceae bacterium]|jgi:hypothetical protein